MGVWEQYWLRYEDCIPNNSSRTLQHFNFEGFHNIRMALRIFETLTVTSCECERSFYALRRLKNYNRSTMAEELLNGLASMHIHKYI